MTTYGILVGCDQKQEWLLPWWWDHYTKYNDYPVVFANFGMSKKALEWCQKRGDCLTLPHSKSLLKQEISSLQKEKWEQHYGAGIWSCRSAWFKKPLALLHSPFSQSIWIDLDCQIKGSLSPLFASLAFGGELGIVREPSFVADYAKQGGRTLPDEINYNAGVIVFLKQTPILHHWVKEAIEHNSLYVGDQDALCRAIYKHKPSLIELPSTCNWVKALPPNPEALIHHFTGQYGKIEILENMEAHLLPLVQALLGQSYEILFHEGGSWEILGKR